MPPSAAAPSLQRSATTAAAAARHRWPTAAATPVAMAHLAAEVQELKAELRERDDELVEAKKVSRVPVKYFSRHLHCGFWGGSFEPPCALPLTRPLRLPPQERARMRDTLDKATAFYEVCAAEVLVEPEGHPGAALRSVALQLLLHRSLR